MDHKWKKDSDGAESCEREGCTVRRSPVTGMWQKKRGGHWRSEREPIPPCAGKEAGEAKPAPFPLEKARSQLTDALNWLRTVDESETGQRLAFDGLRALATLEESIRADATRFYRERETYFAGVFNVSDAGQFRADWEGAVKRWEESIRADEREKCAELIEDKWVGCHRMAESCGRDGAAAIRNRK